MIHQSLTITKQRNNSRHPRAFAQSPARTMPLLWLALLLTTALALGCKSSDKAATTQRYERKPIKETTDDQLRKETQLIEAKMLTESGQPESAIAIYQRLLSQDSTLAAANYELSRLMAAGGSIDNALQLAQRAVRHNADNKWYLLHLAALQRFAGDNKGQTATLERVVKLQPEELAYYYELSDAYLQGGNPKRAVEVLNRIEKRIGITEDVSMQKYKIWKQAGDEDKAMRELAQLAETLPNDAHLNGMLGEAYMASGQYSKAKQCYDHVLAAKPDDEYIHISLAEYYKAVKQPQKAYEELLIGMRQPQLSTTNKLRILTNFYSKEEFYGERSQEALNLMDAAMEDSADSVAFATFYGDMLMHNGRYNEAAHQFALALQADSSHYELWEALLISELSGDADTAVLMRDAQRAARLFPLHQLPLYVQGAVHHEGGRYPKALECLNRCEEMGFVNGYLEPEVYLLKAECLGQIGLRDCDDYYERYLKLRPNDMNALNSYAYRLAEANRNLEKALKMSRQTLEAEPNNHYYLDTYAWILHQMGNDDEARIYMKKAMENGANSPEVMLHWKVLSGGMGGGEWKTMEMKEMKGEKVEIKQPEN